MKKFLIPFFALLLVLLPCRANAVQNTNYLEGLSWSHGIASTVTASNGLSVTATNITKSFSSPVLDIAPAIKQCFYDSSMPSRITVKISGKLKIDFEDNKEATTSLRFAIRAKTSLVNSEEWKLQYENILNGDTPFFKVFGTNVYASISDAYSVSTKWTEFSENVTVTKNNAFCELTPEWLFCVDGIKLDTPIINMHFTDMRLELISATDVSNTPTPTPNLPTSMLIQTPKPTASPRPLEETKELFYNQPLLKDINTIISWAWKSAVVIIVISGFFAITLNLFTRRKK